MGLDLKMFMQTLPVENILLSVAAEQESMSPSLFLLIDCLKSYLNHGLNDCATEPKLVIRPYEAYEVHLFYCIFHLMGSHYVVSSPL